MSKRKIPKDAILIKERAKGFSGADIARKYNMSRVSVARHLKRLGITKIQKGKDHARWKGGRGIKSGYWTVYNPTHPRALNIGRVWEHILVMEKHIKRYIKKGEMVHHINLNRLDNNIKNLYLCASSFEHMKIHNSLDHVTKQLIKNGAIKFHKGQYRIASAMR